ncbi:winged helix-turn-helix domain-containing protein [Primorskyibacter marinus]|uniref:winged helix-turn-helix domain-containing protein n=1 Tax=Primorskyibacter marinus TaxID=1977320 RepID=UPI000E304B20|nr:crosslink repair DNA glycosylase YcaQ family protein [Primorskyibacter marinus]
MTQPPVLKNRAARRLFLDRHALAEPPTGPAKGADLAALIKRLGFVQIDSINTVARAHHMILHARRQSYRPANLAPLLDRDRAIFEHWTHDAAVIPTEFYPYWHLRCARDAAALEKQWRKGRPDGFEDKTQPVLDHIRTHGPASSSEVGKDEGRRSGGWWEWHPSKTALEYLWRSGALAVTRRDGFRKIYDLAENVIPERHLARRPTEAETIEWACNAALDRLGFATSGEIAAFWAKATAAEAKDWVARGLASGALQEIDVEGADGSLRRSIARPGIVDAAQNAPKPPARMRVLSPFDPALRDRARAERLFGFHYRIEVFTPAAKRIYGYYVFPLLEGDRLVGRIDMKADRAAGVLNVTAVWPERGVRWTDARHSRLEAELARIARFAGLEDVRFPARPLLTETL